MMVTCCVRKGLFLDLPLIKNLAKGPLPSSSTVCFQKASCSCREG